MTTRSKELLDIDLIKMVSETMLVKVNGLIIMNDVSNIRNSRTNLGWGVLMDGKNYKM